MIRVLLLAAGAIAVLGAVAAGLLYLAPGTVISLTQWQAARSAGLTSKTVSVDGYETHYFEGGKGPVLIMLHGMADDRHSFVGVAKELAADYRVVLPDLMGHGDNAANPGRDYSIAGQRVFIGAFADALNVATFSLVGNSMGGHVAAAYALDNQARIERLVLVNAPGLVLDETVIYGGFGEPLRGREDFDALMKRVLYNPPAVPDPIKQYLIEKTNARMAFINSLADSVRGGADHDLSDRIAAMQAPTLIVWGEEDVVVPFIVAEAYAEHIPDAELVLLSEAGHSPQMEAPDRVANAIRQFLNAERNQR